MNKLMQLIKYGFWGGITTLVNLVLFYAMVTFNINYLFANVTSYIIAVVLSYYLNNKFVFNHDVENSFNTKKFIRFCVVRIAAIAADTSALALMVSVLRINIWVSKVAISVTIILVTYLLNKYFVFAPSENKA